MQALLVLDVLDAIFELPVPLHDPAGFMQRVRGLLDRARAARVPIFHAQQLGADGSLFAPDAPGRRFPASAAPLPGEHVIQKSEPDMFYETPLAELLASLAVDELVICGFASEACVDTTVRSAWAKRFKVTLAAGAHDDRQRDPHRGAGRQASRARARTVRPRGAGRRDRVRLVVAAALSDRSCRTCRHARRTAPGSDPTQTRVRSRQWARARPGSRSRA